MKNYLCKQCETCKFLSKHDCWKTFNCKDCENYRYCPDSYGSLCGCLLESEDGTCKYYQKEKILK